MFELEVLLSEISGLTPASLGIIVLAGLVIGVSPSSFPLLSVATGFVAGQQTEGKGGLRKQGFILSLGFVFGIAVVDAALGAIFGSVGFLMLRVLNQYMSYAYAFITLLLIFLGLVLLRVVRVRVRLLHPSKRPAKNFLSAFVLGVPFGLSTCPACTPLLLPVLAVAASSGDPILGGILLFTFGLSRGVPILLVGTLTGVIKQKEKYHLWISTIEKIGGILLLLAAPYFAYQAAAYAGWVVPMQSLF